MWFVFIGHGAPSKDGTDGLLVGVDADRSAQGIFQRSVPRTDVLQLLAAGAQAQTVAFIDACFSGQTGDGSALVGGLQPLVPTALLKAPKAGVQVLTAASSGEFSGQLPGLGRPAFSYLALGGLMGWADLDGVGNRDGRVNASELREYVAGALNLTVQGRSQTPMLLGADAILGRVAVLVAPDLMAIVTATPRSDGVAASGFAPVAAVARDDDGGGRFVGQRPSGERVEIYGPVDVGGTTGWFFDSLRGSYTRLLEVDGQWVEEALSGDGATLWSDIHLRHEGKTLTLTADGTPLLFQRLAPAFAVWDGRWVGDLPVWRPRKLSLLGELGAAFASVVVDTTGVKTAPVSVQLSDTTATVTLPPVGLQPSQDCVVSLMMVGKGGAMGEIALGTPGCPAGSRLTVRGLAWESLLVDWSSPSGGVRLLGVLHRGAGEDTAPRP